MKWGKSKEKSKKIAKKFLTNQNAYAIIQYVPRYAACWCGSMAEQLICNQQVDGSTPFTSSTVLSTEPK